MKKICNFATSNLRLSYGVTVALQFLVLSV